MKITCIFLLSIFLSGCVSINHDQSLQSSNSQEEGRKLVDTRVLKNGLTIEEVKSLLGTSLIVGYKKETLPDGKFSVVPIKFNQPYKEETLKKKTKTYTVLYYYTTLHSPEGTISDEELTPLVFERNKLVGQGQAFLKRIKN